MKKRILSAILAVSMLFGCVCAPEGNVNAAQNTGVITEQEAAEQLPTGRLPEEVIELSITDSDVLHEMEDSDIEAYGVLRNAQIYTTEWDKYKSHYFYNRMTAEQREFYDELEKLCSNYLLTKADANKEVISGATRYYTDTVTSSSLGLYDMVDVITMFRVNNPQYYFLSSTIYPLQYGGQVFMGIGVYSAFVDGDQRANATAAVKAQADAWEAQANICATEAEKVKLLHDLIIDKVEYNEEIYSPLFEEDRWYTQSAYSVFCTDLTVCAGYSQAYAMMCNACGVDAVVVTSETHEWNKVRIDDSWYNVDLTWADGDVKWYQFFERNDYYYDTVTDGNSPYHHAEEAMWDGLLPLCTLDTVQSGDYTQPGTLPSITQTTAAPKATVKKSGSSYQITMTSATPGAEIYYTLDGSIPSPVSAKCQQYKKTVKTNKLPKIRMVAVCNGSLDSAVTDISLITYNGNGADSGTMALQSCISGGTVTLKPNGFKKKDAEFIGWNTKANGKGTAYTKKQVINGIAGNLTLYAQWGPKQYKITYQLNGGKNNSKNPAAYTKNKAVTLKNPTKKGYTFAGWYSDKKLTKKVTKIAKGSTGKVTLYAKWTKNKYKITYQLNGGKNNSKNPSYYYVTTSTITLKKPTKSGYTFAGWYSDKKCTKKVTKITKGSTGGITLYAKWKKKK